MNVTILIGNGFDRNLGLDTKYSDFVEKYKQMDTRDETLKNFRQDIKDNEDLWSSAELALGKYTSRFNKGEGEEFYRCQEDFCDNLARYLRKQENRVDFDFYKERVEQAFSKLNSIISSFPTQERGIIQQTYRNHNTENIKFNFICFNYTNTLRKCLQIVKASPSAIQGHSVGGGKYSHSIGTVHYVHGTLDGQMVFGVDDETQIDKVEIFDCEYGDLYQSMLIKRKANAQYRENSDDKALKILMESHIIYIYGMSIGDTDKIWWSRVCNWLSGNNERHLIVQKNTLPPEGLLGVRREIEIRNHKKKITRFGDLDETRMQDLERRIHVTDMNIFDEIKNIAEELIEESTMGLEELICIS